MFKIAKYAFLFLVLASIAQADGPVVGSASVDEIYSYQVPNFQRLLLKYDQAVKSGNPKSIDESRTAIEINKYDSEIGLEKLYREKNKLSAAKRKVVIDLEARLKKFKTADGLPGD